MRGPELVLGLNDNFISNFASVRLCVCVSLIPCPCLCIHMYPYKGVCVCVFKFIYTCNSVYVCSCGWPC